jgi:hypothetical protein
VSSTGWATDLDALRRRLAERLRRSGASHPDVAAAALAARGDVGLTVEEWALMTGVEGWAIDEVERGDVAWGDVPPPLREHLGAVVSLGRSPR